MKYLFRKLRRKIERLFKRDYTVRTMYASNAMAENIIDELENNFEIELSDEKRERLKNYLIYEINSEFKWVILRIFAEVRSDIYTIIFDDELEPDEAAYGPIVEVEE